VTVHAAVTSIDQVTAQKNQVSSYHVDLGLFYRGVGVFSIHQSHPSRAAHALMVGRASLLLIPSVDLKWLTDM
jgi:hypothetical protein